MISKSTRKRSILYTEPIILGYQFCFKFSMISLLQYKQEWINYLLKGVLFCYSSLKTRNAQKACTDRKQNKAIQSVVTRDLLTKHYCNRLKFVFRSNYSIRYYKLCKLRLFIICSAKLFSSSVSPFNLWISGRKKLSSAQYRKFKNRTNWKII